ncbi:uncharacterized protein LOC125494756 [Beta vulgaris subsp. vulgaris]|uniref:uncharacterized protein LOC125494756 n=1 Tax=Beta vulgaris subsp. vulgaris TaxID=3555 RepID=UPI00254924E1|nr:uncharacterized protein LOC125494756 [Beta vulgaris subsp. vulgaris]
MSNLTKLEFAALDITGKNYLSWVLDAEIHLDAKDLGDTIKEGNKATSQNKAKAMIFLRHHLHELKLCGEKITDAEMLEKTYTTFHANNVVLQTQYREKEFKKYSELISCLLVAEQNNELLMKNHESRPTGSAPFPEANATSHNGKEKYHANNSGRGRGRGRGYGHGRGRGRGYGYGRGRGRGGSFQNSYSHQKGDNKDDNKQEKDKNENVTNVCYRCGGKGHWSRTCRTPKHLVDLYQQSLKQKGKKLETNLVYEDGEGDFDCGNTTHLEVADFFTTPEGNNNP